MCKQNIDSTIHFFTPHKNILQYNTLFFVAIIRQYIINYSNNYSIPLYKYWLNLQTIIDYMGALSNNYLFYSFNFFVLFLFFFWSSADSSWIIPRTFGLKFLHSVWSAKRSMLFILVYCNRIPEGVFCSPIAWFCVDWVFLQCRSKPCLCSFHSCTCNIQL